MTERRAGSESLGLSPTERAAAWLVHQDRGDEQRDSVSFEAWCNQSPNNRHKYEEAQAAWDLFGNARTDPLIASFRATALRDRPFWAHKRWLAAAATLAFALSTGVGLRMLGPSAPPTEITPVKAATATYRTERGQRLAFTLSDGTAVLLNTDSALTVAYSAAERLVTLNQGQAFFEVAKHKIRPFVVVAGLKRVIAVGTAFDVRAAPETMRITLVEGRVAIDPARAGPNATRRFLSPGQQLTSDRSGDTIGKADIDAVLLWRQGLVQFDDVPLSDAVAEMNRYAGRPVMIADARIAKLRVSGLFKVGEADRFADLVGEVLPVDVRHQAGATELVAKVPA